MAKKKQIKNLRTSSVSRSFSLASLGLRAGAKAAGHAVGNLFSGEASKNLRKKVHLLDQAVLLTKELGQLKGSLMKAGQMLSVYGEHFLPAEVNQVLKTLQSDSDPVEWEEMRKVLLRQLGKEKMAQLQIEQESLAAASLGQVHRAKILKTGEEIVLKIQYPGVDKAIDGDIKTLRRLLSVTDWLPKIPATDDLFAEVKSMLRHELDYEREREMLSFFREKLKNDERFILPKPIPDYSSKRVLAMSLESGSAVDSEAVATLSQARRNKLAISALDLYFQELFLWKKVQTDPHFGNYRVRIDKDADKLLLFDYGAVREVSDEFIRKYRAMLRGIFYSDRSAFERGAAAMGILEEGDPQALKDLFYELCAAIVEPFAGDGPYDWKRNDLPKRVSKITWEIFKKYPLRTPPKEVVFLDRKMAGMFTFMAVLGANFNAREILKPYLG